MTHFFLQEHVAISLHLLENLGFALEAPLSRLAEVALQGRELIDTHANSATRLQTGRLLVWHPSNIVEPTARRKGQISE